MPRSITVQSERTRRRSPLAARLDLSRQLDRPAKQQQFFGQGRLASVGVQNDRESARAPGLLVPGTHKPALAVAESGPPWQTPSR
jgi:hypothetical protein